MSETTLCLHPRTVNLSGRKFGFLTVISFAGYKGRAKWICRCQCGNRKEIGGHDLERGHIVSCGCGIRARVANPVESQPEWHCYMGMIDRCRNKNTKNYNRYGGMGVTVCERWKTGFAAFIEDMGKRPSPRHSLDRYPDKNGNYEPGNVRWATAKEQARNTRCNRILIFRGESRSMAEWAEIVGIPYRTLQARICTLKWNVKRALTT